MKIRIGFVSNSSSESFTCDVCGGTESGFDASPSDFGMSRCVNGHTICDDHLLISEGTEKVDDEGYGVSAELCPICQIHKLRDRDLILLLLKKVGMTREQVEIEVKSQYLTIGGYKQLMQDLYPKKENKL